MYNQTDSKQTCFSSLLILNHHEKACQKYNVTAFSSAYITITLFYNQYVCTQLNLGQIVIKCRTLVILNKQSVHRQL